MIIGPADVDCFHLWKQSVITLQAGIVALI